MHRLIVAFLAAFDSVIAAAVGVAAVLAPLTLLWIFGFDGSASWGSLWPAAVSVWQLGNLVPLHIRLPPEYLAVAGIGESEGSFLLSLAPLAFAAFTAVFAARSGARASRADAWMTGVVIGSLVFGGLTAAAGITARNPVAAVHLWQAVLFPTLVFAVPALAGAVVTEWREAGAGVIARIRDRVEAGRRGWGDVVGMIARGSGVVLAGLIGAGALAVAVAVILGGGEIIALFEAANVDLVGAVVLALGQLAYLPTLIVWGIAYIAGPGFALGTATSISPAGMQSGIVPGVPVLGILPEEPSPWLLLLALVPLALGALAGWVVRSRLAAEPDPAPEAATPADLLYTPALTGLLAPALGSVVPDGFESDEHEHEPVSARLAIAVGVALVSAGGAALLAWVASGSLGPGRLAEIGPTPGPVALAVGLEVLVGAAILLLSPRRRARRAKADHEDAEVFVDAPSARVMFEPDAAASVVIEAPAEPPEPKPKKPKAAKKPKKPKAADSGDTASSAVSEPDAVTAPIDLPRTTERPGPPVD